MTKFWKKYLSNISTLHIGEDCVIHAGVHIHDQVIIGDRVKIEAQVFIPNGVTIEDDVFVGPQVCFTNDPTINGSYAEPTPTLVKKGAHIGANSTIRAGVVIGEGSIVGCGSVVLKDIPPHETWAGNPARKIRG